MSNWNSVWAVGAPPDFLLLFEEDAQGEHALVRASFDSPEQAIDGAHGLEGVELDSTEVRAYCTLPGEAARVADRLDSLAREVKTQPGTIKFLAIGGRSAEPADEPPSLRQATIRVVMSLSGSQPRHYSFDGQCERCGEFRGKIHVMPRPGVMLDTRELRCRCQSIPCRYCQTGTVRRPLSEHLDPERRSGHMPWFGYLVPCGLCQTSSRGPQVVMSA